MVEIEQDIINYYYKKTFQVLDKALNPLGTSVFINGDQALTNEHVIRGHQFLFLGHPSFTEGKYVPVKTEKQSKEKDLAILRVMEDEHIEKEVKSDVTFFNAEPILGKQISWMGYPILPNEENIGHIRMGTGVIGSNERKIKDNENDFTGFDIDGNFNHGNSGGPIIDPVSGQLIGLVDAIAGSLKHLDIVEAEIRKNFSNALLPLLSTLKRPTSGMFRGETPGGWLGPFKNIPEVQNIVQNVNRLIVRKFNISDINVIQEFTNSDSTFSFPPSINIILSIEASYVGLTNLIKTLQLSYQMGVGIGISASEIIKFLEDE